MRPAADSQIRILLINDAQKEYARLCHILAAISTRRYQLTWCSDMGHAMEAMLSQLHDVILLDYSPDAGQRLLANAKHQGCKAPIIVMTDQMDIELDQAAIKAGAADYLIKGQIDTYVLERAIRYALDRKEGELKLAKLAHYDALSGVPNRVLFRDRLERAIQRAERGSHAVALLFLDFDGFKNVNDTYGHAAGDRLIAVIAQRLSACMRRTDSVARLGGDEFTVVLEDVHSIADVVNVAKKIVQTIARPFPIAGNQILLGCSIGIAQYPEAGKTVDTLLKNADMAMYQAKQVRGSAYRFYTDKMNAEAVNQQNIEDELGAALQANELQLYFQPRVDLRSLKIIGVESLLRWQHPTRGLLQPKDFLAIASNTSLITRLDYWVIHEACRVLRSLDELGGSTLKIAMNLSVKSLQDGNFLTELQRMIEHAGIDAGRLEFELNESALMVQVKQLSTSMRAVNKLGPVFLLDNFGSGYSSFPQLQRLPIAAVKIDQSLVQNLQNSDADARIVKAMINLARSLELTVIAEGADALEQVHFLQ
ncbi:MAG: putative bifunctional diguanylate cyclase/phosphodiesterase, partial [Pseudomonadales bacterium]